MPTNILMPALSPTMEKGNLAKWHVKEGDKVASGDVIAEIETDKATMEVEAVDEGTIGKIMIAEGTQDIAVNAVIAVLLGEGERPGGPAAAAAGAEDRGAALPVAAPRGGTTPADEAAPSPSPQPAKGKAEPTPGPAAAEAGRPGQPANGGRAGGRVVASPLARRLAGVAGIDLSGLKGSGPRGRIVSADVAAAQKSGAVVRTAEQRAQAAPAVTPPPSDAATLRMFADGAYDLVPHDGMRKTIARRLLQSKQTIPHFYLTADVELDALLALRKDVNDAAPKDKDGNPAFRISVNDFVIKALALALRAIPDANVSWTDAAMVRHKVVNVGVAVSIPGGLITPVVRRADEKTLSTIAAEMKDLAKRARDRKLKPAEYEGGSTAVSNLGMYGVKDFAAIVNPPHATILAVGAGEERAVARKGALAVATVMSCTLSTDHRAVDGALGAELMQAFKALIEKPVRMLV